MVVLLRKRTVLKALGEQSQPPGEQSHGLWMSVTCQESGP
jgi:hypothetical protein